jgi:hypothetical protein
VSRTKSIGQRYLGDWLFDPAHPANGPGRVPNKRVWGRFLHRSRSISGNDTAARSWPWPRPYSGFWNSSLRDTDQPGARRRGSIARSRPMGSRRKPRRSRHLQVTRQPKDQEGSLLLRTESPGATNVGRRKFVFGPTNVPLGPAGRVDKRYPRSSPSNRVTERN